MESSGMEFQEQITGAAIELTDRDRELLEAIRGFEWSFNTLQLTDMLGKPPQELEAELAALVDKECLGAISYKDGRPTSWFLRITNQSELERLKENNNPDNEPVGHYTGRCMKCESNDLWSEYATYGCKCCGAFYATGDMPPRKIENGTGRDLGPAW